MRHYSSKGTRGGDLPPSLTTVPARRNSLNQTGRHLYIPRVTREHLLSNRGGDAHGDGGQVHLDGVDVLAITRLMRRAIRGRPIGRVRPRIQIPDSTTTPDQENVFIVPVVEVVEDGNEEAVPSDEESHP